MDQRELPLGLGMALAQNEDAMRCFEALSQEEKQAVVRKAHAAASKREMEALVAGLTAGDAPHFF